MSLRIKSCPDRSARKAASPVAVDHRWAHRAARKLQHEQLVAAEARA